MTDQMEKTLEEILIYLKDGMEQAGALAQEQMPLLVQEYLRWGIVESLLLVGVGVAIFLLTAWGAKRADATFGKEYDGWVPGLVIRYTGGVLALVFCGVGIFNALQIWIAPRVYLLEQAKELIK